MTQADGAADKPGKVRWLMVGIVLAIAAVAYLDRSNISIAASLLKHDLALTDVQLGFVFSAFVLGYAVTQPIAGRVADRNGAYRTIAIGILLWSVLTAATAMIPSTFAGAFATLLAVRFLLGIGESVIFPASNRLVANWIPSKERGLANGLVFAGVGLGAGIAPPLITTIMLEHSWRWAFMASAAIGVVALVLWLIMVRDSPARHFLMRKPELDYIHAGMPVAATSNHGEQIASWRTIIGNRQVMLLTLSYFCFGYVAYIFFSWFFVYLSTVRGLDLKSSGMYGMLPFIAMALASPFGGLISDKLAARYGRRMGRCAVAGIGMACAAIFVALATQVADARVASLVLAAGSGSLYLAQSAFWTLSADLGRSSAGSVAGVMNMGGQLGGAVVASLTPVIASGYGWSASFLFTAALAMVGAAAWIFIDPDSELNAESPAGSLDVAVARH
jgi:ACS family glucarate transporter-like MFS transporter